MTKHDKDQIDQFARVSHMGFWHPDEAQRLIKLLRDENKRLGDAYYKTAHEVEQTLGKALGYSPLYPEVSQVDDGQVCVGEHIPQTIAEAAAREIERLRKTIERYEEIINSPDTTLEQLRQMVYLLNSGEPSS